MLFTWLKDKAEKLNYWLGQGTTEAKAVGFRNDLLFYIIFYAYLFLLLNIKTNINEPHHEKTAFFFFFAYAKTKAQISFTVTAKLISTFVFTTWIVQSLYFLSQKFQASSQLLWLYSPVCVGPGRKPRRQVFSQPGSNNR